MRCKRESRKRVWLAVYLAALTLIPTSGLAGDAAGFAEGAEIAAAEDSTDPEKQIVVYYFHGARRCKTCRTIEAYSEEVIASRFAKEIESGKLKWEIINYDEPENEHFIKEFGLVSASLVVVEMNDDAPLRFEVLQKAWSLVRNKSEFDQYVHGSILDYLG